MKDRDKRLTFIVLGIVAFIVAGRFLFKKLVPGQNFQSLLKTIQSKYGNAIAKNVERIYRFETADLTSAQFKKTYSPGMMAFGSSYPWGWASMDKFVWSMHPSLKPIGVEWIKENPGMYGTGGGTKPFLKFPNLRAAMFTLAEFLLIYDNNPGRWFSLDESQQSDYNEKISQIETQFT